MFRAGPRRALLAAPAIVAASYSTSGVNFDGTNDSMARGAGLTGAADGKFGVCSLWFKLNGGDSNYQIIFENAAQNTNVFRDNANKIAITTVTTGGSGMVSLLSTSTFLAASATGNGIVGWNHICASWRSDGSPGSRLVVNGVSEATNTPSGSTDMDYTDTDWVFGQRIGGSLKCNMDFAEFVWNVGTSSTNNYLDLNVAGNVQKFRSAGGAPVDLGVDGSTPTGAQPIVFFKGPFGSWNTNLGSGGNFTITGALTASATNPP